jgi:hypothetical protein
MSDRTILWEETVQPGGTWSHVLKRGTALRITDRDGGAAYRSTVRITGRERGIRDALPGSVAGLGGQQLAMLRQEV